MCLIQIYNYSIVGLSSLESTFLKTVESSRLASEEKTRQIEKATREEQVLQEVIKLVLNGWPRYQTQVPEEARSFFAYRGELSYFEGKLLYLDQVVIPALMREEIVLKIHDGHFWVTKCLERANSPVWWPGISKDIKKRVYRRDFCQINRPSQRREPLMPSPLPERP